jgi:predicted GNAT family acetyltransferase
VGMPVGPDEEANVVRDHRKVSRFELAKDGHVAILKYERRPDAFVLVHTEVPPALQGTGVGTRLVKGALAFARAEDRPLIVQCSFVLAYLKKHPEAG